jgi:CubicO group peptidase (beta-lactamase class C family)
MDTGLIHLDETALEAAASEKSFSGVVTIDVGDTRVLERCDGFAHRAFRAPMTADTRLAMASGSKTFTALAVVRLVEDGVLRLEQPVRDILGADLPLIDDAVTIEHLLGHTSGIGDYLDEEADWEPTDYVLAAPVHTLTTAEAFLPLLDGFPQKATPGAGFSYCNGGYAVLAIVLERATGETYHDVVRRLVFAPAGLERTDFLRLDELPGDAAVGYLHEEGDRVNTLHLPVLAAGDGGAFTTAGDLHLFWQRFFEGAIVSAETVELMTTPRHYVADERMHYGLGVYLPGEGRAAAMEGYDSGVSFRSTHIRATRTTASVLGNTSEGAWPIVSVVAEAVEAALAARTTG